MRGSCRSRWLPSSPRLYLGTGIVLLGGGPTWLHESAGAVLLLLVLGILVSERDESTRPPGALARPALVLGLLVAMGAAGATLTLGLLPASDGFVPGALLVLLVAALTEMVRFAWTVNALAGLRTK